MYSVRQLGSPQVEKSVLEAGLLRHLGARVDRERQGVGLREHHGALGQDFDLAGRHLRIHGLGIARDHRAEDLHHPLGAHRVEGRQGLGRLVGLRHDLSDATPVPEVEKEDAAMVATPLHPGLQQDLRSDIRTRQRSCSSALHDFTSCP